MRLGHIKAPGLQIAHHRHADQRGADHLLIAQFELDRPVGRLGQIGAEIFTIRPGYIRGRRATRGSSGRARDSHCRSCSSAAATRAARGSERDHCTTIAR